MINKEEFNNAVSSIRFLDGLDPAVPLVFDSETPVKDSNTVSWNLTDFPRMPGMAKLASIRGMSSAANAYLINTICRSMSSDQIYLNVGVFKEFSMFAGMIDTKCKVIGIDDFSEFDNASTSFFNNLKEFYSSNMEFHRCDYVEHMRSDSRLIDFYFYDGRHGYQDQYDAIINARHKIDKGSIVMIDDTNYTGVKEATFKALTDIGAEYDIWLDMHTPNNMHPTYWNGILIFEIW